MHPCIRPCVLQIITWLGRVRRGVGLGAGDALEGVVRGVRVVGHLLCVFFFGGGERWKEGGAAACRD